MVQIRDGLKTVGRRTAVVPSKWVSTARLAFKYFSSQATGERNVHPASAADMNINGIFGPSVVAIEAKLSIALTAEMRVTEV
jgi:hypothetical protein